MPLILKETITHTFLERVRQTPLATGFQFKKDRNWERISFREFYEECQVVSFGLMGLGLQPGSRVGILSRTRYEWALSDMAILGARAVTVPIYPSSTAEDCTYLLEHSGCEAIIVENKDQFLKIWTFQKRLKSLKYWILLESFAVEDLPPEADPSRILSWNELKTIGRREEALRPQKFEENLQSAKPHDLITIAYTSGTTGIPKGVMLNHENLMSVITDVIQVFDKWLEPEREVLLAFLPFSHIIGKVESMTAYAAGYCECYAESPDRLIQNLSEVRPTLLFAVPRIFEKAYSQIIHSLESGPTWKRLLFRRALGEGRKYEMLKSQGNAPTPAQIAEHQLAKNVVFGPIVKRFGGKLKFAISGGAPLSEGLVRDFGIIGLTILEGYGLTETSAPISINTPEHRKAGSVGKLLPEVSVKIAEDREILVRSRKVFQGYYRDPQGTEKALRDEWFHTGDLGDLDSEGYLFITGRKKELIVTSGGKNIAPLKIENLAQTHRYIHQLSVHGDRRNYLTALVTLDQDLIQQYAEEQKILYSGYAELVKHYKIRSFVQKMIDDVNSNLAGFEMIRRFAILPHDFSVEAGELTPSLKLKRHEIERRYETVLNQLYEETNEAQT